MANLQSTSFSGSFSLVGATENTGSAGYFWFDTGSISFNVSGETYVRNQGVWSTGGSLINARCFVAGAGTQNAGLAAGGGPALRACTEEYDGTTWTTGGDLITARSKGGGAGTQDAALMVAGEAPSPTPNSRCTEEYDGTAWAAGGLLINGSCTVESTGTQNSALATARGNPGATCCTEEYNGTSWSTGGAMPSSRFCAGIAGTQNAGLVFGGGPSVCCNTLEYNGSSWATGGNLTDSICENAGAGTQNAAITFGGTPIGLGISNSTQEYDGITWTSSSPLPTLTVNHGSAQSAPAGAALAIPSAASLEYTAPLFLGSCLLTGNVFPSDYNVAGWTVGSPLSTPRKAIGGTGTQSEALAFGGETYSPVVAYSCTEEYDGTSWTAGGALIVARAASGGAGTQNAGLAIGGSTPSTVSCTEEYDGSTWTAGGALIQAIRYAGSGGTQNEAITFGGAVGNTPKSCTEEYDGTSWTSGGALITARWILAGAGTQNAALAFGGATPDQASCTEEYDGTTWSTAQALIYGRADLTGYGTQNAAHAVGGYETPTSGTSISEEYDGTTWSGISGLIIGRSYFGGTGNTGAGLVFGGDTLFKGSCTEEYVPNLSIPLNSRFNEFKFLNRTKSVNINAWATNIGHNDPIYGRGGAGSTQNDALLLGGRTAPGALFTCTEEYNGSTWTAGGNLIQCRSYLDGTGAQNAALAFGGCIPPTYASCTEEYNGISWSTGGALINARIYLRGTGTQNAGLVIGGADFLNPPYGGQIACTEEYNGTSWSTGGALITARFSTGGVGTQNEALAFGGSQPNQCKCTEEYNGSSWSTGGAMIQNTPNGAGAGTQNDAITYGTTSTCTEKYNGTSWATDVPLLFAINTQQQHASGNASCALGFGGYLCNNTAHNISQKYYNTTFDLNDPLYIDKPKPFFYRASSWSTAGNTNIALTHRVGVGTQNAALAIHGSLCQANYALPPNTCICTEEYNGISWSNATGALNIAGGAGAGTQNAALYFGGYSYPGAYLLSSATREYNGSSWSTGGSLITARMLLTGTGTQNEALAIGGGDYGNSAVCSNTEEYNGTSWSNTSAYGTFNCAAAVGTQNAALAFGGETSTGSPPSFGSTTSREYNGTSWTSGNSLVICSGRQSGVGTQNDAYTFGWNTQRYDGTTWSVDAHIQPFLRCYGSSAGSANSALQFGGLRMRCINANSVGNTQAFQFNTSEFSYT
jgi:hypothetical protein